MALTRIYDDSNRRGQYLEEVTEFIKTGWAKATTDIYPDKRAETKVMGFNNAIRQLGAESFIKIKYNGLIDEFTLERY